MKKNITKKRMLMLAVVLNTNVHAMDPIIEGVETTPVADVPMMVAGPADAGPADVGPAAAPAIELSVNYSRASIDEIKTEIAAGLSADIPADGAFDLTKDSYSYGIAQKLLSMDRDDMVAKIAMILRDDDILLSKSGQLFRWLNDDNADGNTTGKTIWNYITAMDTEKSNRLEKYSVAWFRQQIKNSARLYIEPDNADNYILANIGNDIAKINLAQIRPWHSGLSHIPSHINQLTKLKELNLSCNQITQIDAHAFRGLTALQKLYLHYNEITTIALGVFTGLTALRELDLCENKITTISTDAFTGLTALQYLNLERNQLTHFPCAILTLTKLRTLRLYPCFRTETPLAPLIASICAAFSNPMLSITTKRIVAAALEVRPVRFSARFFR